MMRRNTSEEMRRMAQLLLLKRRRDRTYQKGGASGGGGFYHPKVQALITYANANGITVPSAARLTVLSAFITALDTAGILALLDELKVYTYNDATLKEFSKLNIITPGSNTSAEVGVNMTYSVDGWLGGTSSALSTGFIPSTHGVNYTLNSCGYGVYVYSNAVQVAGAAIGSVGSAGVGSRNWIFPRATSDAYNVNVNCGTTMSSGTNTSSIGLHSANRPSSATQNFYTNGTLKQSQSVASGSLSDRAQYVCGHNNNGTTVANANQGVGMNYHGANLTSNMADFDNAWDAYLAAIFF